LLTVQVLSLRTKGTLATLLLVPILFFAKSAKIGLVKHTHKSEALGSHDKA